jgi:hypothetical protein
MLPQGDELDLLPIYVEASPGRHIRKSLVQSGEEPPKLVQYKGQIIGVCENVVADGHGNPEQGVAQVHDDGMES